jgi:hypothetical protein
MAAPTIPPIRLGLTGTGPAVEKPHWPALCGLADRYVVTAFTDSSAERSRGFADHSGAGPARADRAASLARDEVDAVPGAGAVPLWRPRGSTGPFDGLPGQRISSSASFAA